jgi:hypothetical protein
MKTLLVLLALSLAPAGALADPKPLGWGPPAPGRWFKNNMHLIDEEPATGFALYRVSEPDGGDMEDFCALGIEEMIVMSGDARKHELKHQARCPTLRVVYDVEQGTKTPVDRAFLDFFDDWVTEARRLGKKVAFRCSCGCHRTGRLAAYYQMKYQGITLEDAKTIMTKHGKWMAFYPYIYKQVTALHDYVRGVACSTKPKYCVRD